MNRKPTHPDNVQVQFDDAPPRSTRPLTADKDDADALDFERDLPYPGIDFYIRELKNQNNLKNEVHHGSRYRNKTD